MIPDFHMDSFPVCDPGTERWESPRQHPAAMAIHNSNLQQITKNGNTF